MLAQSISLVFESCIPFIMKFMAFSFAISINNITEMAHAKCNVPIHPQSTEVYCS